MEISLYEDDNVGQMVSSNHLNSGGVGLAIAGLGIDLSLEANQNSSDPNETLSSQLPFYIKTPTSIILILILIVGSVGNSMVAIVISTSRDMRTSTNIFLVNLSLADLLVLIICIPTAVLEVYEPEKWIFGRTMCILVPIFEYIVSYASILTILSISFERYCVICYPLKANYMCTKQRALCICIGAWIVAILIASPMYLMITYGEDKNGDSQCNIRIGEFWEDFYSIFMIIFFFFIPLIILTLTYALIAKKLTKDRSQLNAKNENLRARRQVVLMLGTVVLAFFICLLPFRILSLIILVTDNWQDIFSPEAYQLLLNFSKIMLYLNSAINPCLYNLFSSKFRNGFARICFRGNRGRFQRSGTLLTHTTTTSVNLPSKSPEFQASLIGKNGIQKIDRNKLNRYTGTVREYSSQSSIILTQLKMGTGEKPTTNLANLNGRITPTLVGQCGKSETIL